MVHLFNRTRLAVLAGGLLAAQPVAAQVGLYGFQNLSGTYAPLTGATTVAPSAGGGDADDGYSLPITLPFGFQFGTQTFTTVTLSTNGYLGFGTHTVPNNYNVFNSAAPNPSEDNVVAFANVDLEGVSATQYSVLTTGTAPNRIFKLEAKSFQRFSGVGGPGQTGSAQVWLYEGSNDIEIHYGTFSTLGEPTFSNLRVGLRGASATDLKSVDGQTWAAPAAGSSATATMRINGAQGILPTPGQTFRFTFPTGQDLTPPVVGTVTVTPPGGSCAAQPHVVSVQPTDASGIGGATLTYTVNAGAPQTLTMTNAGGTWSATIPAQGTGHVAFSVTVTDASPLANQSTSATVRYADVPATVSAGADQTINLGQTATLTAAAPTGTALKISEITFNKAGTGATTPLPAYIGTSDDDFVEISNTGEFELNLEGYGLEVRSSSALATRTYTFPASAVLPMHSVLVLHLGPGTDDPANRYFHAGGTNDALFSGNDAGLILTSPTGAVLDAVALNGYAFTSTVTAADWSTPPAIGSTSGRAGATLTGADLNNGTNWMVANTGQLQTLGAYNAGLPADASLATGVTWTGGVLPAPATTNPLTTPAHATAGTYTYTATYTQGGCTVTDQVVVTVTAPTAPVAEFVASTTTPAVGAPVTLTDQSSNLPTAWSWTFSPNTVTFINGTSATSQNPQVTFDAAGCYTISLTATNAAGSNTRTRTGYVCAALQYCTTNLQQNACTSFGNFINTVSISGTALNNPNTGCNGPLSYVSWPASGATTATLTGGQTYTLNVTTNSVGSTAAWLDGNANGQFEASEYIQVQASGQANVPATVTFTVPASTPGGVVVLRIRNSGLANTINSGDACVLRFSGETEDYSVTLVPGCALAAPTLSTNGPVCAGQALTLTATGVPAGATYAWTGPNGFTDATASPTISAATAAASGTYSLTITSNGCTATATVTATVNAPATVVLTGLPTTLCSAESAVTLTGTIDGVAAATGFSIDGTPATQLDPATLAPGAHVVTLTGGTCPGTATATVTITATPATPTFTLTPQTGGGVLLTSSAAAGNQWFFNGQLISGATGTTYLVATAAQNGSYSVQTTVGGCASALAAPQNVVITGLTSAAAATLQLTPNPTTGWLTLSGWPQGTAGTVTVLTVEGRTVQQVNLPAGTPTLTLDLRTLPAGVYVVRAGALVRRVVRE